MKQLEEFFYAQERLQSERLKLTAEIEVLTQALQRGCAVSSDEFRQLKEKLTLVLFTINSFHY
jgi:hypothetical protein